MQKRSILGPPGEADPGGGVSTIGEGGAAIETNAPAFCGTKGPRSLPVIPREGPESPCERFEGLLDGWGRGEGARRRGAALLSLSSEGVASGTQIPRPGPA